MRLSARDIIRVAGLASLLVAGAALLVLRLGSPGRREPPEGGAAGMEESAFRGIRVEVLNAAGVTRLARQATEQLRRSGFDVVYYGNAPAPGLAESRVLDRVGSPEKARAVAEALGITHVRTEPDSTLYLDVTVLLGRDWPPPVAPADSGLAAGRGARASVWDRVRERLSKMLGR